VGCVVTGASARLTRPPNSDDVGIVIGRDEPYRLAGPARLWLHARMRLRVIHQVGERDPWRVDVVAYQYTLLDADQREILAFHLHPEGPSHVTTPHLHLGAGAGQLRADLVAAHVPTGPVTLAAVVRLAVEGFAARPLRQQWDALLHRAELVLTELPPA
jgi:hypothetical protein